MQLAQAATTSPLTARERVMPKKGEMRLKKESEQ